MPAGRPDSLESRILRELRRLEQSGRYLPDHYGPWTKAILTRLSDLGRSLGFRAYASRGHPKNDPDAGEWLYDLTWIRYDRHNYIRSIPLVLESELGTDHADRVNDFCKLIVARADHRVMVFGASNSKKAQSTIDELIDEVHNTGFSRRGDRYLFAGLLESDGSFLCNVHVVR